MATDKCTDRRDSQWDRGSDLEITLAKALASALDPSNVDFQERSVGHLTVSVLWDEVRVQGARGAIEGTALVPAGLRFPGDVKGKKGEWFRDPDGRVCRVGYAFPREGGFRLTIARTKAEKDVAHCLQQARRRDEERIQELERLIDKCPSSAHSAKWRLWREIHACCDFLASSADGARHHCALDERSRSAIREAIEAVTCALDTASVDYDASQRTALVEERNYLQTRRSDPTYRSFMSRVLQRSRPPQAAIR